MCRVANSAAVVAVMSMSTIAMQSWAAEALLEIQLNRSGDISSVRGEGERSFEAVPFKDIPIEGQRLIAIGSLDSVEVLDTGGAAAWCCWKLGRWTACEDDLAYKVSTFSVGDIERVELQSEYDSGEEPPSVEAVLMRAKKTHTIMVFEDESGSRHGTVVSDDQMWYGPEEFSSTGK